MAQRLVQPYVLPPLDLASSFAEEERERREDRALLRRRSPPGARASTADQKVGAGRGFWKTRGRSILALLALWGAVPMLLGFKEGVAGAAATEGHEIDFRIEDIAKQGGN